MRYLLLALLMLGSLVSPRAFGAAASPDNSVSFISAPKTADQCYGAPGTNLHYTLFTQRRANVLLAWGEIGEDEASHFKAALQAAAPVTEIMLCSNGGNLEEGINIGYLIHERKLATVVPSGFVCISACNFAFMGGLVRTVEPGASFEVHMFTGVPLQELKDDVLKQDWTVGDYALSHPAHMLGRDDLENKMAQYVESHEEAIKADYAQFMRAHPADKFTLRDFVNSEAERNAILNETLHTLAVTQDVNDIQQSSAQIAAQIAEFLVTMRLSLHFLTAFANIPNDTPRPLSRAELVEYDISNTQ